MDPGQSWLIAGGAAWLAVSAAIFARILPKTAGAPLSRAAGGRCLVGAVLGVAMLTLGMWVIADLPSLARWLAALSAHLGLSAFLLAYAGGVEPGREILGFVRPWFRDVGRGFGVYAAFIPVVMAAHALNLHFVGDEVESAQKSVNDVLASDGPDRLALILNVTLAVPLFEELLFRGLLQQGIRSQLAVALSPGAASALSVFIASVAFTGFHETATYVPVFVLSLILGSAYERTGRILVPVALHATHNLAVVVFQAFVRSLGEGP